MRYRQGYIVFERGLVTGIITTCVRSSAVWTGDLTEDRFDRSRRLLGLKVRCWSWQTRQSVTDQY